MADPLSVVASVVGIAAAGVKVSISLYALAETVSTADQRVKSIANDISSTCGILTQLRDLINPKLAPNGTYTSLFTPTALSDISTALNHCRSVFSQTNTYLKRASRQIQGLDSPSKPTNTNPKSIRNRQAKIELSRSEKAKWPFLQPQFNDLRTDLRDSKTNLLLMVAVANLAIATKTETGQPGVWRIVDKKEVEEMKATIVRLKRAGTTMDFDALSEETEEERERRFGFRRMIIGFQRLVHRTPPAEEVSREPPVERAPEPGLVGDRNGERDVVEKDIGGDGRQEDGTEQEPKNDENGEMLGASSEPPNPKLWKSCASVRVEPETPGPAEEGDANVRVTTDKEQIPQEDQVAGPKIDGESQPQADQTPEDTDAAKQPAMVPATGDTHVIQESPVQPEDSPEPDAAESNSAEPDAPSTIDVAVQTDVIEPVQRSQSPPENPSPPHLETHGRISSSSSPPPNKSKKGKEKQVDAASNPVEDDPGSWDSKPKNRSKKGKEKKIDAASDPIEDDPWNWSSKPTKHSKKGNGNTSSSNWDYETPYASALQPRSPSPPSPPPPPPLYQAWSSGVHTGLSTGAHRALFVEELNLNEEELNRLIEKAAQESLTKALFKLNAYQRTMVTYHAHDIEAKLVFVDELGRERVPTVFGDLEIVILMWITVKTFERWEGEGRGFYSDELPGERLRVRGRGRREYEGVELEPLRLELPRRKREEDKRAELEIRRAREKLARAEERLEREREMEETRGRDEGERVERQFRLAREERARFEEQQREKKEREMEQRKESREKRMSGAEQKEEEERVKGELERLKCEEGLKRKLEPKYVKEKTERNVEEELERLEMEKRRLERRKVEELEMEERIKRDEAMMKKGWGLKREEEQRKKLLADGGQASISKEPITFKDAIQRKFVFPFHLVQNWKGMEDMINQAFDRIDALESHVKAGEYDLVGPNDEIILPTLWDITIQPGWHVRMHMWPTTEGSIERRRWKGRHLAPPPPPPQFWPTSPPQSRPHPPPQSRPFPPQVYPHKPLPARTSLSGGSYTSSGRSKKRTGFLKWPRWGFGRKPAADMLFPGDSASIGPEDAASNVGSGIALAADDKKKRKTRFRKWTFNPFLMSSRKPAYYQEASDSEIDRIDYSDEGEGGVAIDKSEDQVVDGLMRKWIDPAER